MLASCDSFVRALRLPDVRPYVAGVEFFTCKNVPSYEVLFNEKLKTFKCLWG